MNSVVILLEYTDNCDSEEFASRKGCHQMTLQTEGGWLC